MSQLNVYIPGAALPPHGKSWNTYLWQAGLTLLFLNAMGAATLTVGGSGAPCPNAQYTTIGAAVTAASPGDVIDICPALYPEQLIITKPLTLHGIPVGGVQRVLLQPTLTDLQNLATEAVITVMNTSDVTIQGLAIDASHNAVSGCTPFLAGIHFLNASGTVENSSISGAQLTTSTGCKNNLPFGNGFGVKIEATQPAAASYQVSVVQNSIHDFTTNGVLATGAGVNAQIQGNTISGVGPSGGTFQFGIFIALGPTAQITRNMITEGLCGALSVSDCIGLRSEGITLRAIGDGTVVDSNIIMNAQSGIFINGANKAQITNNTISNIDAMSGMDIQGTASGAFTNSVIQGNTISNVGPIDQNASLDEEGCGINEYSGTGVSGNTILSNTVNDAYCGVAYVTADPVQLGTYSNTLYTELNEDLYPNSFPPAMEPPASAAPSGMVTTASALPKNVTVTTPEITLDGTGSTSADGKPLTFMWSIPQGSPSAAILKGNSATPTVQFGQPGLYKFQLTVTDSSGTSASDVASVDFLGN